jgi:hypothetical protein
VTPGHRKEERESGREGEHFQSVLKSSYSRDKHRRITVSGQPQQKLSRPYFKSKPVCFTGSHLQSQLLRRQRSEGSRFEASMGKYFPKTLS